MLTKNELITLLSMINRSHINQLTAIFNYIIEFGFKNKLSDEEYLKFLKSINRL